MIARIAGEVVAKEAQQLIVMVGGLGYAVAVPAPLALGCAVGDQKLLYTLLYIRDSSHELYGFQSQEALSFFEKLVGISGVGPKSALHLMALGSSDEIKAAIARGDIDFLTSVSGIGKKTAQRIVIELKGALEKEGVKAGSPALQEVAEALSSLGYGQQEIQKALRYVRDNQKDGNTEAFLKQALQYLQTL